jgi:hypothetical protein
MQPEHEVLEARIRCRWSGRWCNPTGKSQKQRGRESLSELVSTQLNKRSSISLSKVLIISEIHRVFIQGTTLLSGCEWTFEFLELCYVKSHHELKSRTTSCDYWVPAVFTNLVITLYWEVQWTCGLLHCKADFKMVSWSTHAAPELSRFKSYDQIIIKVRTCLNWLSELICPNWTCWILLVWTDPLVSSSLLPLRV